MSITPQPPLKIREGRLKHGSILNGNIGLCRVSSQWQSTTGLNDGAKRVGFALPTIALEDAEPNKFRPGAQPRIVDMEALACRFFGDAIIADLEAQVDAEYAGELGDEVLDASEKRTLLASLDKEIDRLQRELAELIWQAREAGHDVDFPTDFPAAAILGVAA